MISVVLGQKFDQTFEPLAIEREIRQILVDFRAPGSNRVLESGIAMGQPAIPILCVERNRRTIDRFSNQRMRVHCDPHQTRGAAAGASRRWPHSYFYSAATEIGSTNGCSGLLGSRFIQRPHSS